ncbi:hypothetical protein [Olleya sp. Bg11-27]|uniref:hypothetical protein n=1 Tax=Olleya sp. Bg11-27 TaxID=2058135 RepID=UPI000C316690|nr:hypothetical protein [Olleya sp. Bg11-27]AUC76446.1 hypothetical protein CW732_12515 [Olleya sp. Bg11-27]
MKLISILFSLFFASTIAVNSDDVTHSNTRETTKQVVFDGYHGQIYYFTDNNDNTILIEDISASKVLDTYNLDNNKHLGATFNLKLNETTSDNIYSEIQVVSINLIQK